MDIKVFLALVSVLMTLVGYFYYFRDIFAGKTKPHAYSWLVWASLTAIAFGGQVSDNAGPGAWVTAVTAAISFIVFGLALKVGEKDITKSDKFSLAAAGIALVLWFITKDPLLSVIIITVVDLLGFLPTIRKSYTRPYQETLIHYILAGLKFVLAIIALENYTLVTWLYPASLAAANLFFVLMLIMRRKKIPYIETF
jgi:chromate transport protein ChrA